MSSNKNLSLTLFVDKQSNTLLWAESRGDVVDVLFSFLTLPLGTVARVLDQQSRLGCVDELYKTVKALDGSYFQTPCCQDMLLRPRSAAERLCEDLPTKVDDSDLTFYTCWDKSCIEKEYPSVYNSVYGACCRCLRPTIRTITWDGTSTEDANGVFVDRGGRFCISDDLSISPASASTTVKLLQRCGLKESQWEQIKVELSRERILTLLRKLLTSKEPLTETFLQKSECRPKVEQLQPITTHDEVATGCGREFKATLLVKNRAREPRDEVMCAEIGEDTLDLLFSFLTIPIGSIIRLIGKASHLGCMDNLYQSVGNLCATKYCAKLEKHKDMLLAPKLANHFGCSSQLLEIDEISSFETTMNKCACSRCATILPPVCIHRKVAQSTVVQINPKLGDGSTVKGGSFAKGKPGGFMVTDEMMVTPSSSVTGLEFIKETNVHVDDIEVREVPIGKKEALALLRGLLLSRTPLTHAFCQTKKKKDSI